MKLPVIDDAHGIERPRTYGDCLREGWGDHDATGPCPWVSCAHHLAWLRAQRGGAHNIKSTIKPGDARSVDALEAIDLDDMPHTCALRAAELELTLGQVGDVFGVTKEQVRQIETKALLRVSHPRLSKQLRGLLDVGEVERPDLQPSGDQTLLSTAQVRAAEIRINPLAARASEEASRRQGGSLSLASLATPRASSAPPVRVLTGEERARRIAELQARGDTSMKTTITVRGRSLTQEQWAAEFGVTSSALSQARRARDTTIEEEIERRLDLRRDEADVEPSKPTSPRETAPAPAQTPSAPVERPSNPSAPTSPTTALSTTSSPLAAIAELIAAAERHGGVAELLADALVGAAVRRAIAEVSG